MRERERVEVNDYNDAPILALINLAECTFAQQFPEP
jgi:hypothetical protein